VIIVVFLDCRLVSVLGSNFELNRIDRVSPFAGVSLQSHLLPVIYFGVLELNRIFVFEPARQSRSASNHTAGFEIQSPNYLWRYRHSN